MTSVSGSRRRRSSACRAVTPPTSAERSRPPVPIACEIPEPRAWRWLITAWSPVPEAPIRPTGPRRTRVAQPKPEPPRRAVPRSARAAARLGKAEAEAADHRRAAIRSQHQQPALAALPLQRHLALDGHVVAVEENVAAVVERLLRHRRGVPAGHRDQHPARLREDLQGGGEA